MGKRKGKGKELRKETGSEDADLELVRVLRLEWEEIELREPKAAETGSAAEGAARAKTGGTSLSRSPSGGASDADSGSAALAPRARMHPRGYHSLSFSHHNGLVYAFGGISRSQSIAALEAIDPVNWTLQRVRTVGASPAPRHGQVAVAVTDGLIICGGSSGGDLMRDGHEFRDIFHLRLPPLGNNNAHPFDGGPGEGHAGRLGLHTWSRVQLYASPGAALSVPP